MHRKLQKGKLVYEGQKDNAVRFHYAEVIRAIAFCSCKAFHLLAEDIRGDTAHNRLSAQEKQAKNSVTMLIQTIKK